MSTATDFLPDVPITMENGREAIKAQFEHMALDFKEGAPVDELVTERTNFIDALLLRLWHQFGFDQFPSLALIAVGGYGRADLQPHSDIDILILSDGPIPPEVNSIIPGFTSLIWDLKLDLGQSVRTFEECIFEGSKDVTIATNLLESRLITGNEHVFKRLVTLVESDDFWPADKFYTAKVTEQNERHHYYKDTVYMLEPDIKNNPGGLRDIQTILWLAHKKWGLTSLRMLQSRRLLSRLEYYELQECQDFLWLVRFALHISINKPDNRLTFDRQQKVASLLGYTGEGNTPVETLMRRFYQTVHRVRELNEISLQLLERDIFPDREQQGVIYNQYFLTRGSLIDIIDPNILIKRPQTILELFEVLTTQVEITGIYVECIRLLRNARRSINYYLDEKPECREIFKRLIKNPRSLNVALPLMHEHHIIALYMPHWQEIIGLMQFDMFHTYTVDEHTMRVLKNIYTFSQTKTQNFGFFRQVYRQIEKPELLSIAALFHDIAKGRTGHHAELGAPDALYFCQLHGYNRYESRMVAKVVRLHLYMSMVAQRRDISDPDVVNEFAHQIGDENFLNHLYCLTVADICATNDTEWNGYKDSLFKNLYFATRDALRRGLETPPDLRLHVRENQQRSMEILSSMGMSPITVFRVWAGFKLEYFIRYSPEQIAWHTQNILNNNNNNRPLILFGQDDKINGTELFIYTKDSAGLFARVTAVLGSKNLSILSSNISNTNSGYALDSFIFIGKEGGQVPFERLKTLRKSIMTALKNQDSPIPKAKPIPNKLRQFRHPTIVTFLPERDKKYTSLELSTLDVPGLLAKIGIVFQNNNLIIHAAKITTTGERADDFFSITDLNGNQLNEETKNSLKDQLIAELSTELETSTNVS